MRIRVVNESDALSLLKIYEQYIETEITFDYQLPTVEEFKETIKKVKNEYPYLVCEQNEKIIGYAYAHMYKERKAYRWSAELTIYLDKNYTSKGIGKKLYKVLIDILKLQEIKNLYACVTLSNEKSKKFHKSLGFNIAGVFYNTGYKCGQWHDVVYFQKSISNHNLNPNPFIPINRIEEEKIKEILK